MALHAEVMHTLNLVATIDCTPGDGQLAFAHVKQRLPYVGIAHSDTHKEGITKRLVEMTSCATADNDDALAEPGLVSLMRGEEDPNPVPKKKAKAGAKAVATAGAKAKAAAKAAEEVGKDYENQVTDAINAAGSEPGKPDAGHGRG